MFEKITRVCEQKFEGINDTITEFMRILNCNCVSEVEFQGAGSAKCFNKTRKQEKQGLPTYIQFPKEIENEWQWVLKVIWIQRQSGKEDLWKRGNGGEFPRE